MRRSRALLAGLFLMSAPALAAPKVANPVGPYPANTLPTDQPDTVPHTLMDALGITYETNPTLTGERAHQRSIDENVPAALAGWRPTIALTGQWGAGAGRLDETGPCGLGAFGQPGNGAGNNSCYSNNNPSTGKYVPTYDFVSSTKQNRLLNQEQASITEYLYRGGKTTASTHQATNEVFSERANLIAVEEQVLQTAINAYVTYVEDAQLLTLDLQNEQVLGDELRAVNDQFKVGELTRTDVAQAEAALAQAISTRQTAEGTLQTAAATFYNSVGVYPPKDLADPQPLRLPVVSEKEASDSATRNNPNVIAALFSESAAKDNIDLQFAALGPQIYLQGQAYREIGASFNDENVYGGTATINLSLPLYQGGSEYAAIRQARQQYQLAVRQTAQARRTAQENAVQAWDTLIAARAATASSRIAVRSAQIAVEGTERQALVGSATTQAVLIQQQNLLAAETTLVQNVTNVVTASYGVAAAIGRLTARDLGLAVPLYDETAYYNAVRNRLWGTGDYAVQQPGR
jgi:outer membrane protein